MPSALVHTARLLVVAAPLNTLLKLAALPAPSHFFTQALQKLGRTAPRLVVAADKATPELVKQLQALSKANEELAVVLATEQVPGVLQHSICRSRCRSTEGKLGGWHNSWVCLSLHWLASNPPVGAHTPACYLHDHAQTASPWADFFLAPTSPPISPRSSPVQRQLDDYGLTLDCTCKQELLIDDPKASGCLWKNVVHQGSCSSPYGHIHACGSLRPSQHCGMESIQDKGLHATGCADKAHGCD